MHALKFWAVLTTSALLLACQSTGEIDQPDEVDHELAVGEEITIDGLGTLRRDIDFTELSRPSIYHIFAQIAHYEKVVFTLSPQSSARTRDELMVDFVRPACRIKQNIVLIIAEADSSVRALSEVVGVAYSEDWAIQLNLHYVVVEPKADDMLVFDNNSGESGLFAGRNVIIWLDQYGNITRTSFN